MGGASASNAAAKGVLEAMNTTDNPVHITRSDFVGRQVGKDLARNAVWALLFVIVGFLIYIAFRFEWKFAVAAILTTLHDVLIVAGYFALTGREFDLTVLAGRSEEHTSELQSLMRISYAVFCLKKTIQKKIANTLRHDGHAYT